MLSGWKTLIFGAIISFLGSIQAVDLATIIPPQYTGAALAFIGVVVMVLRAMTTTAIGVKK